VFARTVSLHDAIPQARAWRAASILLIGGIFCFYVATIRDGYVWDDDQAQYILHARNIVDGRAYKDTGYVFNPDYATLGPVAYPPGFPLLLAPIWATRGPDLHAMKLLEVACFAAWLAAIYAYFSRESGEPAALLVIAVMGLCPLFWDFKDFIGSDLPFAAVLFLTMVFVQRVYARDNLPSGPGAAVLVALSVTAACSIRSVGALLIPCVFIYDVLRNRRLSRFAAQACTLACVFCLAMSLYMKSAGGTLSLFRFNFPTIIGAAKAYTGMSTGLWQAGGLRPIAWLLEALAAASAAWMVYRRVKQRERLSVLEVFSILYISVLLVYAPREVRFLFPVFPFYVAFVLCGVKAFVSLLPSRVARLLTVSAVVALLAYADVAQYRTREWGVIRWGCTDPEFLRSLAFIRTQTAPTDVILFRKPRLIPLLAGRRAMTYAHRPGLGGFVHAARPRYVLAPFRSAGTFASDAEFLWPFLRSLGANGQLVYSNGGYAVYRVLAW